MNATAYRRKIAGFTLMEVLVAVAIVIVLVSIATPIVMRSRAKSRQVQALKVMANLGAALHRYAADHNGMLPAEDISGKDDWAETALPTSSEAWYNALPRAVQNLGVGDFVAAKREAALYTPESMLFLPGADYPNGLKKARPYFAIAMNSRLQRKAKDGSKPLLPLTRIGNPSRTVAFFERGMPGEKRAHPTISKADYDGSPKGTAKSFVARYIDRGVITFVDGSAKDVMGKDLLHADGSIVWSADQAATDPSMILWSPDPQVDPNASGDQ